MTNNYIDKAVMLEELAKYHEACKGINDPDSYPKIPNRLGKMFIDISENMARRPNFSGYSFLEEMIADGIENCLRAVHNFDPSKSNNPFGYFSRIIWFAFLRRIDKEKKEMYNKYKFAEQCTIFGTDTEGEGGGGFLDIDGDYITNFVKDYEERIYKRSRKTTEDANTGIEDFFE